jgi:hypothetical protein
MTDQNYLKFMNGPVAESLKGRGLSYEFFSEYIRVHRSGFKIFILLQGSTSITKIDALVKGSEQYVHDGGIDDWKLLCMIKDKELSISAKLLTKMNTELYDVVENATRVFLNQEERDFYYDDVDFIIDTAVEKSIYDAYLQQKLKGTSFYDEEEDDF